MREKIDSNDIAKRVIKTGSRQAAANEEKDVIKLMTKSLRGD